MFASATRSLLLRVGAVSLGRWVRGGAVDRPGVQRDTAARYRQLAAQAPWPEQQVNRVVLAMFVLPMAALYQALLGRGYSQQEAVAAVSRAMQSMVGPERTLTGWLARTDFGRRLYLRLWRPQAALFFPPPAWQIDWLERSADRAAFDITRCYVVDTLRGLGCAPVAPAFCSYDSALYEGLCPKLRFTRTGTIATGAPRCDFRFENLRAGPSTHESAA